MTEQERLMQEAISSVFSEATANALVYGVGMIKVSFVRGMMELSVVDREEFMDTAEQLQWLDKHAARETKQ